MATVVVENGITLLRCDWHIEDVQSLDESLTDEQCIQVLEIVAETHDANLGVNWDVIQCAIDELNS